MDKGTPPTFKIIVATHKPYNMPSDQLYQPILVGSSLYCKKHETSAFDDNFAYDNTGINMSDKNPFYSELCGLFWLWQNFARYDESPDSFYGLVHYRRFLSAKKASSLKKIPTSSSQKAPLLKLTDLEQFVSRTKKQSAYDIILPEKRHYIIESLYNHYSHTLHVEPLDRTRKILEARHPQYLFEFDRLKTRRSAHMFNIFILRKNLFNQYCDFLFDVLFALEKSFQKTELDSFDSFHSRFFGRISELLLDVFLYTNCPSLKKNSKQPPRMIELEVIELEPVDWSKKISNFLLAKFFGKKYQKSY